MSRPGDSAWWTSVLRQLGWEIGPPAARVRPSLARFASALADAPPAPLTSGWSLESTGQSSAPLRTVEVNQDRRARARAWLAAEAWKRKLRDAGFRIVDDENIQGGL